MTVQELYQEIGGSYEQAVSVMRIDKLIAKHICRFPASGVVPAVLEAGQTMDPKALFETSHAMKGVCANLGLTGLADAATVITEEFRPGHERTLTDDQIKEKLAEIEELYAKTVDGIQRYEKG